jgi:hypothetical protein
MVKRLQTFILVSIITLFIWLIAEAQSLDTQGQLLQVQLKVAEQSRLVITSGSTNSTVQLELQGSTASLDRLLHNLTGTMLLTLETPGEFTIDLQERLSEMPPFKGSGVNIRSVDPDFMERVVVERLITVDDVQVRPTEPNGVELRGSPTVSPVTVSVAVPESALGAFQAAKYVNVVLDDLSLASLSPGPHTINVPLAISAGVGTTHAVISPSTVALTLDVRDSTETWTPEAPLPVQVQLPADLAGEYRITVVDDRFIEVTFTGPSQSIERLKQDRARAVPFIALTSDDLARGVTAAAIQFRSLPAGVTATPAQTSVTVEITDLTPGE